MKKVYGVGINDSKTPIQTKGWVGDVYKVNWRCPFYTKWANMLKRCYGKNAEYEGYKVDERWHRFSSFRSWMQIQDWEGKHLDKDLFGNNMYSPDTCVFISNEMNSYIKSSVNKFGLPRGVTRNASGSIYAHIAIEGKNHYLGIFDSVSEAKRAYLSEKIARAKIIFDDQPSHILEALIRRLESEN